MRREQLPDRVRARHPRRPGRRRSRPRSARPTTSPAPAARAMARSAGESPTTATRGGSLPRAWHTAKTGSGAGFIAKPSSPQTIASTCVADAERAQGRVGRGAVVGRDDGDPPPAAAERVEEGAQVGQRRTPGPPGLARTRQPPWPVAPRPRLGTSAEARPRRRPGCRPSSSSPGGRRRRLGPSLGRSRSLANTSGETGRRAVASRRVPSWRAQPPHIAWKSMSVPSLSKMTRSIPLRSGGVPSGREPSAATASPRPRPARRCCPGRRRWPRTRHGLGREPSTIGEPAGGTARFGLLKVSTNTGVASGPRSSARARPSRGTRRRPRCPAGGWCRSCLRSG